MGNGCCKADQLNQQEITQKHDDIVYGKDNQKYISNGYKNPNKPKQKLSSNQDLSQSGSQKSDNENIQEKYKLQDDDNVMPMNARDKTNKQKSAQTDTQVQKNGSTEQSQKKSRNSDKSNNKTEPKDSEADLPQESLKKSEKEVEKSENNSQPAEQKPVKVNSQHQQEKQQEEAKNENQAKNIHKKPSVKSEKGQEQTKEQKKQPEEQRQEEPKHNSGDFSVSADLFINMKKGNIQDYYKVGQILGEGAFGQVSKVVHKSTQQQRAMKTIKKSSLIKEEEQKLFSEMNILKNLDHPNIVRLYDIFQDSRHYYLITEYCSGGELFDKIKQMNHFTEKMAADYMKQILSAVVYCHKNSIVHRDLKPENLLLDSDKRNASIKVIDFGTSRRFDKAKKMTKRLGTPYYIAPEVLNQNYDEKCDVWSCGVILFILLCGYPPFGGRSEEEILKKVKSGKFKFDPEDWDKISEDAKNLIRKMLTLDHKKRISAQAALDDDWIQKNAPQLQISPKAMANLSAFQTRSKIKQVILTFIVSQVISKEDKEELQKTFRQLDKNGDGRLNKEELIEGYTQIYGNRQSSVEQVEKILASVDINKSGQVDFTEFLMASMQKEQILSKQKIEQAFKLFDIDGNGFIEKTELDAIMGGSVDDQFWVEVLKESDTNKDGKISLQEFIDLLTKKKV